MARRTSRAAHTWRDTPIATVIQPIEAFVAQSTSGGIVLLVATVLALLLANLPATRDAYFALLATPISLTVGAFHLEESVLHFVNDGLMALFFLLVGLEIKREVAVGELRDPRAALLPIAAALGGVLVPALLYTLFNWGGEGARGWGVPMATDIAFALGCLALLGKRIPFALKIFLTAVAIVDDLMAVVVIALFYSGGLNFTMLGLGFALLALLWLANRLGIRALWFYLAVGVVVWYAFLESGVHATIAGVLLAFTIPARSAINDAAFADKIEGLLTQFRSTLLPNPPKPAALMIDEQQNSIVQEMESASEAALSPLQRLEHLLHTPVQMVIMPIFALANAGVPLVIHTFTPTEISVMLGIIVGLVVGKPVGLLSAAYLVVRSGLAPLPAGVRWAHMVGAGLLAGVGFTMSLFIAGLGFGEGSELLNNAKLAILAASILAGSAGMMYLSRVSPAPS